MNYERGKETYLGEGVFASFDGNYIKLRTPLIRVTDQEMYLCPKVYKALLKFYEPLVRG